MNNIHHLHSNYYILKSKENYETSVRKTKEVLSLRGHPKFMTLIHNNYTILIRYLYGCTIIYKYLKGGENMEQTIIGIFADRADVEGAIDKLKGEKFNPEDISIVMKDKREQEEIGNDTGANVAGGALSGATTGAVVGGIAGLLAGTVLPGLGGFLIGGPIGAALGLTGAAATTVSGAATGAVAGGLIGALMGIGLKRDDAEHYQQRVEEGAILVAVPTNRDDTSYVQRVFDEYHAQDIKTIAAVNEEQNTHRHYADDTKRTRSSDYAYASGAKGGHTSHSDKQTDGRGWHGESEHHAAAKKGKEPH